MSRRQRVLLVGPLPLAGDVIGGTKVSFAAMVEALRASGRFEVSVHDTSRPLAGRCALARALANARGLAALALRLADPRRRDDVVVFNSSSGGALSAGPLVWALCKLRRARLVVRLFGGDLDLHYEASPRVVRALARRTLLAADLLLLQTRALCDAFARERPARANVQFWPTTRDLAPAARAERRGARRFLFVGQLRREKGIAEAVAAAESLPPGAELSVYGPPMAGFDAETLPREGRCAYHGAAPSADVPRILAEHDVLVFPSYHAGEGMPGVVVEAMQAGLPVVAARWRALPELVEHERNGLLVEPRDERALAAAMRRLAEDPALYARLARGAEETGERFRAAEWNASLVRWLAAGAA